MTPGAVLVAQAAAASGAGWAATPAAGKVAAMSPKPNTSAATPAARLRCLSTAVTSPNRFDKPICTLLA